MSRLILASASASRRRMLTTAGVPFEVIPAHIDEAAIKDSLKAEGASAAHIAEVLAELKAIRISERYPDALVLGADQTLALGKETLDKPASMEDAARQLARLSGGRHVLPTAAVMAERGSAVWREIARPSVTFRPLSEAFIASYLERMGDAALQTVGACEVEGLGAQLISRIDGDFYAVLGLPLLQVLEFLRAREILPR
ncbi:MAG: Maf family nucleotide pyrophosphatase [Alphaproteobacteria bacterium]